MLGAQAECVQHGLRVIAFCHTRKLCELVIAYTRETLRANAPKMASSIAVYRGGYSPKVRMASDPGAKLGLCGDLSGCTQEVCLMCLHVHHRGNMTRHIVREVANECACGHSLQDTPVVEHASGATV